MGIRAGERGRGEERGEEKKGAWERKDVVSRASAGGGDGWGGEVLYFGALTERRQSISPSLLTPHPTPEAWTRMKSKKGREGMGGV